MITTDFNKLQSIADTKHVPLYVVFDEMFWKEDSRLKIIRRKIKVTKTVKKLFKKIGVNKN